MSSSQQRSARSSTTVRAAIPFASLSISTIVEDSILDISFAVASSHPDASCGMGNVGKLIALAQHTHQHHSKALGPGYLGYPVPTDTLFEQFCVSWCRARACLKAALATSSACSDFSTHSMRSSWVMQTSAFGYVGEFAPWKHVVVTSSARWKLGHEAILMTTSCSQASYIF